MSNNIGKTIAQLGSYSVIGFGLIVALAAWPQTSGIADFFVDLLFWPLDGLQAITTPEARLIAAIGGGVMVGWGVTMLLITKHMFDTQNGLAKEIIVIGLAAWYVVDSTGSAIAGSWLNVFMNMSFPLAFYIAFRIGGKVLAAANPSPS